MKKMKKILTSPITTVAAFALAAGLLLFSSVGGARAALTYFSDDYETNIEMHEIGVTLKENDAAVPNGGKLLTGLLPDGEELKLGKTYPERLSVSNSGVINEYVRVNIHKYWLDQNGEKLPTLSPDLIELNLVNLGSDWLLDEDAATDERTVLYYNKLLTAGSETPLFADKLTIGSEVASEVSKTEKPSADGKYTVITLTYEYNGAQFCIEAKVDAVQEHNAQDAIWSAWGRRVTISDGTLKLD